MSACSSVLREQYSIKFMETLMRYEHGFCVFNEENTCTSSCANVYRHNDSDGMWIWMCVRVCLPAHVSVYSRGAETGYLVRMYAWDTVTRCWHITLSKLLHCLRLKERERKEVTQTEPILLRGREKERKRRRARNKGMEKKKGNVSWKHISDGVCC